MGGPAAYRLGDCRQFGRPERIPPACQRWPLTLAFMASAASTNWRQPDPPHPTPSLAPRGQIGCFRPFAARLLSVVAAWNGLDFPQCGLPFRARPVARLAWILPLGLVRVSGRKGSTPPTSLDGADGLAAGCGAVVFAGFGVQLMLRGQFWAIPALAGFCAAMAGHPGWVFLAHKPPSARMFNG